MSRSRRNLEDLVGGLLDHEPGRSRRTATAPAAATATASGPDSYPLTAPRGLTIRAARAVDAPEQRAEHAA